MESYLTDIEVRILGVLIEKQMATPEYYPLTLNSLVNACNQKTNRDPVMNLNEEQVQSSIENLRKQRLVMQVRTQGSRTLKYQYHLSPLGEFSNSDLAILCVLLLRGPQTLGELRSRTTRLTEFHGLAAVEHTLNKLMEYENGPFVEKLPRQPGHKENRFIQLLGEKKQVDIFPQVMEYDSQPPQSDTDADHDDTDHDKDNIDRISLLEERIDQLESELSELKAIFLEFKKQFE